MISLLNDKKKIIKRNVREDFFWKNKLDFIEFMF